LKKWILGVKLPALLIDFFATKTQRHEEKLVTQIAVVSGSRNEER